jgi:CBS domain-containing protein
VQLLHRDARFACVVADDLHSDGVACGAGFASGSRMARTVAEIMNPKLLYIGEGAPLSLARSQIVKFGVTAIPILDELHRPIGVVSLRDFAREDGRVEPSAKVHMVQSDASLEEGARTLAALDAHHLVVVDSRGVAVGMVSALDFVRAFLGLPARHPAPFECF